MYGTALARLVVSGFGPGPAMPLPLPMPLPMPMPMPLPMPMPMSMPMPMPLPLPMPLPMPMPMPWPRALVCDLRATRTSPQVLDTAKDLAAGLVHSDGHACLQSVSADVDPWLNEVLEALEARSGRPAVLTAVPWKGTKISESLLNGFRSIVVSGTAQGRSHASAPGIRGSSSPSSGAQDSAAWPRPSGHRFPQLGDPETAGVV